MRFGALGDIHGQFELAAGIQRRHPEVPFWLSVGDVAGDDGRYEAAAAPTYWIKGNNEDFDLLGEMAEQRALAANLHYVPNAVRMRIDGLWVAGLGGTFAPRWYDTPPGELPAAGSAAPRGGGRVRDDKRRHFVREEVDACRRMREIDVFLTHEAPRPFLLEGRRGRYDAGKPALNAVLAGMRPRLHLFGHHHRFSEAVREGVPSVGLELVSQSYLLVDAGTLRYERVPSAPA
jgi:hypothetical protein